MIEPRPRPSSPERTVQFRLAGLQASRIADVLAAYGLLVALSPTDDAPAFEARMAWPTPGGPPVLHTNAEFQDVLLWLTRRWAPTPVVSPWLAGSGFGVGWTARTLRTSRRRTEAHRHIAQTTDPRWRPFQESIAQAADLAQQAVGEAWTKEEMLAACLAGLPEAALPWVNACFLLDGGIPRYSPLTGGTGGNVGSADLSRMYADRVWAALTARSGVRWLQDALSGRESGPLLEGSQAHLERGVGPEGTDLVNPWRWVLAMVGITATAPPPGAVPADVLRSGRGVIHPWQTQMSTLPATPAGVPAEDGIGETWLPLPKQPVTGGELRALLTTWPRADDGAALLTRWDMAREAHTLARQLDATLVHYIFPIRNGRSALAVRQTIIAPEWFDARWPTRSRPGRPSLQSAPAQTVDQCSGPSLSPERAASTRPAWAGLPLTAQ